MKRTILFLPANPSAADRLALDREASSLHRDLEFSRYRDSFVLETRWTSEPLDLLRELRKLKPTVVQFNGHGIRSGGGEHRRDIEVAEPGHHANEEYGLSFLYGSTASMEAIAEVFGAASTSIRLVVLNACYTEPQAQALLVHVDCVVGTSSLISSDAARTFATGFYGALADGESIEMAFRHGRAAISLSGSGDAMKPQLKVRVGVEAGRLFL